MRSDIMCPACGAKLQVTGNSVETVARLIDETNPVTRLRLAAGYFLLSMTEGRRLTSDVNEKEEADTLAWEYADFAAASMSAEEKLECRILAKNHYRRRRANG